jgi:hypothetical protein
MCPLPAVRLRCAWPLRISTATANSICVVWLGPATPNLNVGVAVGDANGDGMLDLVMTDEIGSRVGFFKNQYTPRPVVVLDASRLLSFDVAAGAFGAGEFVQGAYDALDGYGRLMLGTDLFPPSSTSYEFANTGQSVVLASGTVAGLTVSREITVPHIGSDGFARTVDTFANLTASTAMPPTSSARTS